MPSVIKGEPPRDGFCGQRLGPENLSVFDPQRAQQILLLRFLGKLFPGHQHSVLSQRQSAWMAEPTVRPGACGLVRSNRSGRNANYLAGGRPDQSFPIRRLQKVTASQSWAMLIKQVYEVEYTKLKCYCLRGHAGGTYAY